MTARRIRLRRLAVPLVVGVMGLGLAGCSNKSTDAATVEYHDANGDHVVHITRDEFTAELTHLTSNEQFVQELKSTGNFPNVDGTGSTDQQLSSLWLTQLINQVAVDAEFENAKLTLTTDDIGTGTTDEENLFTKAVFDAFPKAYATTLVDRGARTRALLSYFETCPSGRFVSHILLKTKAQADAELALINSGQVTFTDVAKAQSTDSTSGKVGGALGCLSPGEFIPVFEDAAQGAPLGTVIGPVHSQFGYHLILVRKWTAADVATYGGQALAQAASAVVAARIEAMHVTVDPRYGTWGKSAPDANGNTGFAVIPPTPPNPRVCRDAGDTCAGPTTTTTTTVAPVPSG